VDITTADAGSASRYPQPPEGIRIRRLTSTFATGIVRGAPDGKRIAYYAEDKKGVSQVFIIDAQGSDQADDPALRPLQVTSLPKGTKDGIRWTPDGKAILCISDDGLVLTSIVPGEHFGKSVYLTPHGDGINRHAAAFSPCGRKLAYNKPVPTLDASGNVVKAYNGSDFVQIFMLERSDGKVLSSIVE
jgi:Tol biopolymer transport system component